jgi:hypothetical protein
MKIKIFMWYLIRRVVLTKATLLRHTWQGVGPVRRPEGGEWEPIRFLSQNTEN